MPNSKRPFSDLQRPTGQEKTDRLDGFGVHGSDA